MKVRIYYHHTDCGGVVYYANYLDFFEEARTEFLEHRGLSVSELQKQGVLFVVARQEIDYKMPAVYGDLLDIDTWVTEASGVKMFFEYQIKNQKGEVTTQGRTLLVCVDAGLKPAPLPDSVKQKIEITKSRMAHAKQKRN